MIRRKGVGKRNREIRELIGENCCRVDQGNVNDGWPLAVIITCRSLHWNPFRVLDMKSLFVEPVNELISSWGQAEVGEGPIDGVGIKVAHEEHGYGLVKFRGEDMEDGMVARFVMGDLMVDVDETEGLIANNNIEHHRGRGCDAMGEVVDDCN